MNLDTITCADIFDLCATVPDGAVDMILCDLPYGTTACTWDTVIPFEPMWKAFKRIIKPRGAIVLTASQPFTSALVMSNPGWFRYAWVWEKAKGANFSSTAYQPLKVTEDVLVFSSGTATFNSASNNIIYYPQKEPKLRAYRRDFRNNKRDSLTAPLRNKKIDIIEYSDNTPRNIIYAAVDGDGRIHPTQKPVALFEYLIKTYTQPGELVFDPCCGSGTTAIAARRTERHFVCGDSSPEYVAIANERLQNTDPFQDRKVSQNVVQHSLFQGMAE